MGANLFPPWGPLPNAALIISRCFVSFLEEIDGLFRMLLRKIGAKISLSWSSATLIHAKYHQPKA
jgi:hypothetical protein